MLRPALPRRDERGKRWRQATVQQCLAASVVALTPPCSASDPACSWGTAAETETTLSLRRAGDPEPQALPWRRTMLADGGAGRYGSPQQVTPFMRQTLKKRGIVSASHARAVRPWPSAPAVPDIATQQEARLAQLQHTLDAIKDRRDRGTRHEKA
jgi:hypothetical protein